MLFVITRVSAGDYTFTDQKTGEVRSGKNAIADGFKGRRGPRQKEGDLGFETFKATRLDPDLGVFLREALKRNGPLVIQGSTESTVYGDRKTDWFTEAEIVGTLLDGTWTVDQTGLTKTTETKAKTQPPQQR